MKLLCVEVIHSNTVCHYLVAASSVLMEGSALSNVRIGINLLSLVPGNASITRGGCGYIRHTWALGVKGVLPLNAIGSDASASTRGEKKKTLKKTSEDTAAAMF